MGKIAEVLFGLGNLLRDAETASERATKARETVTETLAALRDGITGKRRELERARSAPAPRAEILQTFSARVDRFAAEYRAAHTHELLRVSFAARDPLNWEQACVFLAPVLKSGMAETLKSLDYTEGLPAVERPAEIERLTRELTELEQAEEQFVDGLLAQGIMVEHRHEVKQRRESERLRAEERAAADANRAAREAAINQHHAQQPRMVRSAYVEPRKDPEIPATS